MNFNIYDDSKILKFRNKFISLTAFAFRVFVLVPCITSFFFFSLVAYSAGGVGNIITEYIKTVDYDVVKGSYRVCLDDVDVHAFPGLPPEELSTTLETKPQNNVDYVCQKYGEVSATKKASILSENIRGYYLSIVVIYMLILFSIHFFKKTSLS